LSGFVGEVEEAGEERRLRWDLQPGVVVSASDDFKSRTAFGSSKFFDDLVWDDDCRVFGRE
jgi:hypothetical protein